MEKGARSSEDSVSKDDSLVDFKSPKLDPVPEVKSKGKNLREKEKKSSRSKPSTSKSKRNDKKAKTKPEKTQPSIESSFFKATDDISNGHTCPLCMKYFSDGSAGISHSKSCASRNNVSTEKLIAAVALQARQNDERLALGLPQVSTKEKAPRKKRDLALKGDSDLQLALALSESLQAEKLEQELDDAIVLATELEGDKPRIELSNFERKQTLKSFGFSTSKPAIAGATEGPVRSRRKKHLGPTVLQTRTQETRDRLLSDKIAEIIMGNEAITQISPPAKIAPAERLPNPLQSRLLNRIHDPNNRLWDSAQLSVQVTNFNVEDLEVFIVPANEESASSSPKNDLKREFKEETAQSDEFSAENPELQNAGIEESKNSVDSDNNFITDRQYRNSVPSDWVNTLNSSCMSDVVVVFGDKHIWCHKLVFHVRCSNILLDCEPVEDARYHHVRERVCWQNVEFSAGLAFLEFVYGGTIDKNRHIFEDDRLVAGVRGLARRYSLKSLFDYLRKRKSETASPKIEELSEKRRSPIIADVENPKNSVNDRDNYANDNREIQKTSNRIHNTGVNSIANSDISDASRSTENSAEETEVQGDTSEHSTNSMSTVDKNDPRLKLPPYRSPISNQTTVSDCTMSPDLFDDTIIEKNEEQEEDEKPLDDTKCVAIGEETPEKMSQSSTEENSNLAVLARLLADDSDESSEEYQSPANQKISKKTSITPRRHLSQENKRGEGSPMICSGNEVGEHRFTNENTKGSVQNSPVNASPAFNDLDFAEKLSAQQTDLLHLQTPKSRNPKSRNAENSYENVKSPLKKQKSNLSLFIEKVQKINAKPALESYSEGESLGGPVDRGRFRNPFNVMNASNESLTKIDETEKSSPEHRDKKSSSVNNEPYNSSGDESDTTEKNSPIAFPRDDTMNTSKEVETTDEEDISMYSKYKKHHKHNNSIANYRKKLQEMNQSSIEKSETANNVTKPLSMAEVEIDLTQDTDEENAPETVKPAESSLEQAKIIHQLVDTDSNDSLSLNKNCQAESTRIDDIEALCVENAVNLTSSRRDERPSDEKRETTTEKNFPECSDLDLFEIDEAIFQQKNEIHEVVSSGTSQDSKKVENSPRRVFSPAANSDRRSSSFDDSAETLKKSDGKSSQETRKNVELLDSDSFDVGDVIFTQTLTKDPEKSPDRVSSPVAPNFSRKTAGRKRKSTERESRTKRFHDLSTDDEEFAQLSPEVISGEKLQSPKNIDAQKSSNKDETSPRNFRETSSSSLRSVTPSPDRSTGHRKSKENVEGNKIAFSNSKTFTDSPPYPDFDHFEPDGEIFTQSFNNAVPSPPGNLKSSFTRQPPKNSSPISIASSPEFDKHLETDSVNFDFDFSKENRARSPFHWRQSARNFVGRISDDSSRKSLSPQPETSRSSKRRDLNTSDSARKLMSRSISMPSTSLNSKKKSQGRKSPMKSSRVTMSQQLRSPSYYDGMETPELKRELDKYGLKPMKRKRARQLLKHIDKELRSKDTSPQKNSKNVWENDSDIDEPPAKKKGKIYDGNDSTSDATTQDSLESSDSSDQENELESDVPMSQDGIIGTKSIREAFLELLEVDKVLHTKVLTYEPLALENLLSTLKAQGVKCKQSDLMDFLDEECITFKELAQTGKTRTRKVRGQKNSKNGAAKPSKQKSSCQGK